MTATAHKHFDRAFTLLDEWIDNELGNKGWKKTEKLSNKLDWFNARLSTNLNDDCRKNPSPAEVDDLTAVS